MQPILMLASLSMLVVKKKIGEEANFLTELLFTAIWANNYKSRNVMFYYQPLVTENRLL